VVTEPLALPPCEPGGPDPTAVTATIGAWVRSPALVELVGYFGGDMPAGPVGPALAWAAEFSTVWDFRAGIRERFDTTHVDYGADLDARLRTLIRALGLGGRERPAHDGYDHVVVLGGGIRVTMGRAEYAGRLLAAGLAVRSLTGLGSLRWRDEREHREGRRLGLDPFDTEADMMTVGLRRSFGLAEPAQVDGGDGWWHRRWPEPGPAIAEIHVLAAPSSRPPLRANTADTLLGWATHVHTPAAAERVLVVTNDPYVRHQHCDAVRLLGGRYGCGIETIGYDDAVRSVWGRPLSTTELLQEVRSSLLAMQNLHDSVSVDRRRSPAGSRKPALQEYPPPHGVSRSRRHRATPPERNRPVSDFMDRAKDFADQHDEQVDKGIQRAGDEADKRTGGKYDEQIDKGVDAAQQRTGQGDTSP